MFHMLQKDLPFGGVAQRHGGLPRHRRLQNLQPREERIAAGQNPRTKLAGFMPPYGDASEKSIKQKVTLTLAKTRPIARG